MKVTRKLNNMMIMIMIMIMIFNNYLPKAKYILVNIPRDEVEGNVHQYLLSSSKLMNNNTVRC